MFDSSNEASLWTEYSTEKNLIFLMYCITPTLEKNFDPKKVQKNVFLGILFVT